MHYGESIMTACTNGSSCPTGSFSHLVVLFFVLGAGSYPEGLREQRSNLK